jgi:hypothetical protein
VAINISTGQCGSKPRFIHRKITILGLALKWYSVALKWEQNSVALKWFRGAQMEQNSVALKWESAQMGTPLLFFVIYILNKLYGEKRARGR